MRPETLLVYPYVKFRVSCHCGYRKAYRVTRLAEVYGADFKLADLKYVLALNRCPKWGHDGTLICLRRDLQFTDLGSDNPSDAPPSATSPKLVGK
jgi:hypothetical protein